MTIAVCSIVVALARGEAENVEKDETADSTAELKMQHRSDEPINLSLQESMARANVKQQQLQPQVVRNPGFTAGPPGFIQQQPSKYQTAFQQLGIGAPQVTPPVYHHPHLAGNPAVNVAYQQALQRPVQSAHPVTQTGPQAHPSVVSVFSHPKEAGVEKKPLPQLKDTKPAYYPKQSSYASIPAQPQNRISNSARFVSDPTKSNLIEEISESQLQQLTYRPMHYSVNPHGIHPHGGVQYSGVHQHMPYITLGQPAAIDTATVSYEQTEHGFMDRVWGEVQTVRESITNDFFGAIPAFFRSVWDAIVGAVSSASARMLTVDWLSVLEMMTQQIE